MADIQNTLENIAEQQRNSFAIKQRRERQRRVVTGLIQEYAEHSTIHGLRYIAERGVATQKVFWLLTFLGSLFVCGYCISNVYVKWKTSPVIVSIDEKLVSVEDVPFPSVTICPQIKSRATVFNMSEATSSLFELTQVTDVTRVNIETLLEYYAQYEVISTLCHNYDFQPHEVFLPAGTKPKKLNSTEIKELYWIVSPYKEDVIAGCEWHNQQCYEQFSRVITKEGICFNFNSVSGKELFRDSSALAINIVEGDTPTVGWNSETGYDDSEPSPYPEPGNEYTAKPDLQLLLATNEFDQDVRCNYEFTGFKIYLHNPLDVPQTSFYYYAAVEKEVTSLAVDVKIMKTSESLSHYEPEVRQCYFSGEKYLRFFKVYTANNCELECLTNETLKRCHCIGLYMPHYDASTEICTGKKLKCMEKAQEELINNRKAKIKYKLFGGEKPNTCGCLPSCNDIQYDAHSMETNYNTTFMQEQLSNNNSFIFSDVSIFFKKPFYTSKRRSELFGWTDFVANIGGLLGLFLGFSVLSLIEIVYYLTVKIGLVLKRDREDNIV